MRKTGMIITMSCLMLAMSVPAAASEEKTKFEGNGVSFALPQEFKQAQGYVLPYPLGALDDDHHVYSLLFLYEGLPAEDVEKVLFSSEASDEDMERFYAAQGVLGNLLAADVDYDTVKNVYTESISSIAPADLDQAEELGSADGFTFYLVPGVNDEEFLSGIGDEYAEEFGKLQSALPEALKDAEFYEPVDEIKEMAGQKMEFETTDLDGNTVTSEELFAGNEITMVNCWGVWCINCVNEMEELAQIHKRLQEKGCGIVGLEWEKDPSEETYQTAWEKMKEWGTDYPNALLPEELVDVIEGYPTTFFVDREGNILGMPIVGAAVSQYESTLDALLDNREDAQAEQTEAEQTEAEQTEAEQTEAEQAEAEQAAPVGLTATYYIHITDEDGPVEGVAIQFCDDATCRFGETDEDGVVSFDVPGGKEYEVHVAEVPDDYEEDDTVYHTTDGTQEVNIQIHKN